MLTWGSAMAAALAFIMLASVATHVYAGSPPESMQAMFDSLKTQITGAPPLWRIPSIPTPLPHYIVPGLCRGASAGTRGCSQSALAARL